MIGPARCGVSRPTLGVTSTFMGELVMPEDERDGYHCRRCGRWCRTWQTLREHLCPDLVQWYLDEGCTLDQAQTAARECLEEEEHPGFLGCPDDERDGLPAEEDDDEVAVDWDEN